MYAVICALRKVMRVKFVTKQCNFMLMLTKTRGLRRKQFSVCCCHESSKCSLLALTHTVRWWRHCWTAHPWWHGLASPTQDAVIYIVYIVIHNVSSAKQTDRLSAYSRQIIMFSLKAWVFLLKFAWNYTILWQFCLS